MNGKNLPRGAQRSTEVGMNANVMKELIWGAGAAHVGTVAANIPLPGLLGWLVEGSSSSVR